MNQNTVSKIYTRRARWYDLTTKLYHLAGVRIETYRAKTIEGLNLKPGDTVVDLGCGTGLNLGILQNKVGPKGKIIGVDMTAAMLAKAQEKVRRAGWQNVELIRADVAQWNIPKETNGILSTWVMALIPEYESIIKNGANALVRNGRFAILDVRRPVNMPTWLTRIGTWLMTPWGVNAQVLERQPWDAMNRHLAPVSYDKAYLGYAYICISEKT